TANWITDRQLRSVCTTTLAMLRWTKTSPGAMSTIWLAGTRESEHPIHRNLGVWIVDRRWKKVGSSASIRDAQASFLSSSSSSRLVAGPGVEAAHYRKAARGLRRVEYGRRRAPRPAQRWQCAQACLRRPLLVLRTIGPSQRVHGSPSRSKTWKRKPVAVSVR